MSDIDEHDDVFDILSHVHDLFCDKNQCDDQRYTKTFFYSVCHYISSKQKDLIKIIVLIEIVPKI